MEVMFGGRLDIYLSPYSPSTPSSESAVLFRKALDLNVKTIFVGRLLVLDVDGSDDHAFRLLAVYASHLMGRSDFYQRLEAFLVTSRPLLLVGDWNATLDTRVDLKNLFRQFHLSDMFRLVYPIAPKWTWSNRTGSSRSYLDTVVCRTRDRDSLRCPQFFPVGYTDHKLVTCTLDLDKANRQGPGYCKLNASCPLRQVFRDRISKLVQKVLAGAITINNWWFAFK